MSDFENVDVMLGNSINNPIERELADAIDRSSAHGSLTQMCTKEVNIEITYMKTIYWDKMKLDSLLKLSQMNSTSDYLKRCQWCIVR